jgi:coenzyme PQQ precursor peptide PqqA
VEDWSDGHWRRPRSIWLAPGRNPNYLDCKGGRCSAVREVSAEETPMAWTTPTLVEICIGLEINGYLPAEF